MRVKAVISFCGKVNMGAGEIRDITDPSLLNDLLHAHYVEAAEEQKKEQKTSKKRK